MITNRSIRVKPFLKWVGGKQRLLRQFEAYFPAGFRRYIEPFAGGAAVFFHLWATRRLTKESFLFDNNAELINVYRVVRDNVDGLIAILEEHKAKHTKDYFYKIRALDRTDHPLTDEERAARAIYLNRTCYNGLYRVNRKGEFNVPMGRYKNPQILHEALLRAASIALKDAVIAVSDFRNVVDFARPGDFFYFDPPYAPISRTADFTSYTPASFTETDQRDLARVFRELTEKGCLCMLSNSHTPFVLDLYKSYRMETVHAPRAVNSDASGRGRIREVVVLNYPAIPR